VRTTATAFSYNPSSQVLGGVTTLSGTATNVSITSGSFTWSFDNAGNFTKTFSTNTGNIGSQTNYFNTLFAKATSAQYADLAEKYVADALYNFGTVLVFGGDHEVTISQKTMDTRVAGVVSTNPAYIMNAGLEGEHVVLLALQGRVPAKVVGPVGKGDILVTGPNGYATVNNTPAVGTILGKALETFNATTENPTAIIEIVVGKS
jgi:hypothetical protein